MKPSEALQQHRHAIQQVVSRYAVKNVRVFGSAIHGDDKHGSDLDLLVEPLPATTLFDLGGLQAELEEMLSIPVDVLTPGDLPLKFRDSVLAEAVSL